MHKFTGSALRPHHYGTPSKAIPALSKLQLHIAQKLLLNKECKLLMKNSNYVWFMSRFLGTHNDRTDHYSWITVDWKKDNNKELNERIKMKIEKKNVSTFIAKIIRVEYQSLAKKKIN